jgi:hypothetical protein
MRDRVQPRKLVLAFFGFGLFLSCSTSVWGLVSSLFKLNENQILYLFSTSAQVLAGIYGLTLTGFIVSRHRKLVAQFWMSVDNAIHLSRHRVVLAYSTVFLRPGDGER